MIRNQFGEYTFVTRNPRWLAVPSEKVEEGSALSEKSDHYKIYAVDRIKSTTQTALLKDQFTEETVNVGPLVFFVVPVEKKHRGITFPINHPKVHLRSIILANRITWKKLAS